MGVFTAALVFIFISSNAPSVKAQETDSDEFTLEEITVTAQKRVENQQKVAITMDVISSETIKELGKTDLDDILDGVASAIVQKAADGLRVSLRGISDYSSSNNGQSMAAPTVAVNTDGVYSNRKDNGSSLFDIERVEVLYGPQSTMYSSNSPGGIVNVVTASPKIDKYEVSGSIEVGNYNLLHTEAAVNVPVGDKVALRTSLSTSKHDGYLSNGGDDENTKSGRFKALYQASDKLSFTGTAELSKDKSAGVGSGVEVFIHQDDKYYADGTTLLKDPWTGSGTLSSSNDKTSRKFSGNMALDTDFGSISLITSYSTRTGDNVSQDQGSTMYQTQIGREKNAELRMTSPSDFFFKWIAGATYYKSKDLQNRSSAAYINTGDGEFSFRTNLENSKALYGNVTYPVMDALRLTGGVRFSWDEMTTQNVEYKWDGDLNAYDLKDQDPTQNTNSGTPDYKIGFEYDLAENAMLYGDFSTSYRVQGMNSSTDPEELKAYTAGAKSRLLENKLQLNGAAYYYDYTNYFVNYRKTVWIEDLDGDNEMDRSAPDSTSASETSEDSGAEGIGGDGYMYGFDVSANALITANDFVNLSVSYLHSEWTDLYIVWEYSTELELVNGVATEVTVPDSDYKGKSMSNTPEWTINLGYTHNFNLWNGGVLKVGASGKYQSNYRLSWNDDEYPENYQESFFTENANVSYNHSNGMWTLSAYVKNISNYAEKRMYMNAGGNGNLTIGNPRTYGAVLSVKF